MDFIRTEPSSGETLLSALKFIRDVYQTSEKNLKHTLLLNKGIE